MPGRNGEHDLVGGDGIVAQALALDSGSDEPQVMATLRYFVRHPFGISREDGRLDARIQSGEVGDQSRQQKLGRSGTRGDPELPLEADIRPLELVQHLLDWLVPSGSVATTKIRAGEAAALVPLPEAQSVDVITPDGRQVRVAPPFPAPPVTDTSLPGIYQVIQRDGDNHETHSAFAANFLEPGQSQLQAGQSVAIAPGTGNKPALDGLAAPREIWQLAAMIGLLVLVAEWWLFQRQ